MSANSRAFFKRLDISTDPRRVCPHPHQAVNVLSDLSGRLQGQTHPRVFATCADGPAYTDGELDNDLTFVSRKRSHRIKQGHKVFETFALWGIPKIW